MRAADYMRFVLYDTRMEVVWRDEKCSFMTICGPDMAYSGCHVVPCGVRAERWAVCHSSTVGRATAESRLRGGRVIYGMWVSCLSLAGHGERTRLTRRFESGRFNLLELPEGLLHAWEGHHQ